MKPAAKKMVKTSMTKKAAPVAAKKSSIKKTAAKPAAKKSSVATNWAAMRSGSLDNAKGGKK